LFLSTNGKPINKNDLASDNSDDKSRKRKEFDDTGLLHSLRQSQSRQPRTSAQSQPKHLLNSVLRGEHLQASRGREVPGSVNYRTIKLPSLPSDGAESKESESPPGFRSFGDVPIYGKRQMIVSGSASN
jgi:hypothetical protein